MKILIITNTSNEEIEEDIWIAESFVKASNKVAIVNMNYPEELDNIYDVFIRRNTWYSDESKVSSYYRQSNELAKRLKSKNLCLINFNGEFDGKGKKYLCDLYDKNYPVVPTVDDISKINKLTQSDYYILKPINSYDGVRQIKLEKEKIKQKFNEDYIIQPFLDFVSEIQFYFIGTKFEYALEFKPSKVPVYPDAEVYSYTKKELEIAKSFAELNKDLCGIQRIDFMKLADGKLLLLEIEDTAPYLDLDRVSKEQRNKFLEDYTNMIYDTYTKLKG